MTLDAINDLIRTLHDALYPGTYLMSLLTLDMEKTCALGILSQIIY